MSWTMDDLRVELAKPAYGGLSDAEALAGVLAVTTPGYISFSPADAMLALAITTTVDWGWLSDVAAGTVTSANASGAGAVAVTAATRRLAKTFYDMFTISLPVAVTTSAKATLISNGLAVLVTANVITTAGRAAVEALPQTNVQTFAGATQYDIWVARGQV